MTYRVLVDENTSPVVVDLLREAGHEAAHVSRALDFGSSDRDIAEFARSNEFVVLTHDDDFLRPDVAADLTVLYYGDDTVHPGTLARRVDELATYVPDPTDLPEVTNLGAWE